jgi:hypothetical protein
MKQPKGYTLFENDSYVVIATMNSTNEKTGNMVQIWILNRSESPVDSVKSGSDETVCMDCVHRGTNGFSDRTCYVNVAQGPNAVWRAYRAGKYPVLAMADYSSVFSGRAVRFGAYGEPILIPLEMVAAIAQVSSGWTGYTHQWRKTEYQAYSAYVMASSDSPNDRVEAMARGWRTFRVRTANDPLMKGEIICPASSEANKRTTCLDCKLCNGARNESDARKSIAIVVHGIGAKNFVKLTAIGGSN